MWGYAFVGALIAFFPLASFVLIALEVVMIFQIAKKYDQANVADLFIFSSKMIVLSLFLKFFAAWLHFVPLIGQISNSVVAGGFILFVYAVADEHYRKLQ